MKKEELHSLKVLPFTINTLLRNPFIDEWMDDLRLYVLFNIFQSYKDNGRVK